MLMYIEISEMGLKIISPLLKKIISRYILIANYCPALCLTIQNSSLCCLKCVTISLRKMGFQFYPSLYLKLIYNDQRWAQIHQNVFKIKIQNTVWKDVSKYKILCGKMYLNTNTVFCILKIHKIHLKLAIQ